jgi:hypothetical protein
MKTVKITMENVKEALNVLKGAKWVTVDESNFLTDVLMHLSLYNDKLIDDYFSEFSYVVADMNAYIGYPFTSDPHYGFYANKLKNKTFFITGKFRYAFGTAMVGVINTLNKKVEKSTRKTFYSVDKVDIMEILQFLSGCYSVPTPNPLSTVSLMNCWDSFLNDMEDIKSINHESRKSREDCLETLKALKVSVKSTNY